ncbi:hypothetical protein AB0I81_43730 [Nonomuraea sp. NPDC050404]|uniref:hypothetical protein n=1 Tax=Nonomuraea sp. NPDC050404 TaxID=3155783 RepID=UPI0033E8BF42
MKDRPAVLDRLVQPWLGAPGQAAFYRQIAQAGLLQEDAPAELMALFQRQH